MLHSPALYRTSPLKRKRRTDAELATLLEAVQRITQEDPPITIRHLFYRLVGEHLIEKTERDYTNLCALLARWRRQGKVPYDVFSDATRYYRGPTLFDDMAEALQNTATCYRKNLWASQQIYAEVWCEKDAISSILAEAAGKFGVQVFVLRGFASLSSLHNAAQTFRRAQNADKEVCVFYFGDHDPSGKAIDRAAERTLAEDFGVIVEFQRVAVTEDQIVTLNLPTRPVKKTDTRAKGWVGGCVEIDTIHPAVLRQMVKGEITARIDPHQWNQEQETERQELKTLQSLAVKIGKRAA
jgi:hypothetical protein